MAPKPPASSTVYMSSAERWTERQRQLQYARHTSANTHAVNQQCDQVRLKRLFIFLEHCSFHPVCIKHVKQIPKLAKSTDILIKY